MSVIRQRANLKAGVSQKQNTPSFPKNKYFLPPDTHSFYIITDELFHTGLKRQMNHFLIEKITTYLLISGDARKMKSCEFEIRINS